ncbi:MAG: site-specific integrase [Acidimicrobiia bacterium]|nr:site-specific integrase [Acidimicrobiia bacterium]
MTQGRDGVPDRRADRAPRRRYRRPVPDPVRLAAYTGMRAGEICALRVGRVDLRARRITIAESVTDVAGHGLYFSEPKTYERRSVTLPAFLSPSSNNISARPPESDAFVFVSPEGGTLNHKNFYRRHFKPAIAAAGLPPQTRFHDLRHTCAALCHRARRASQGDPGAARPSSITVTLDRYGHLFPKLDETLTARLDDLHRAAGPVR